MVAAERSVANRGVANRGGPRKIECATIKIGPVASERRVADDKRCTGQDPAAIRRRIGIEYAVRDRCGCPVQVECATQIRGVAPESAARDRDRAAARHRAAAAIERMTLDRTAPLVDQLRWLTEAGFANVECWYRNYRFCVFSGDR